MPKPHQVGFMPKLYQTAAIEHVAETRKGHITNPACVKTKQKKQQKKHGQKTCKKLKMQNELKNGVLFIRHPMHVERIG